MADDEKWGLSREEINKRVQELNQKKKAQGPTRGGRSSGQGVKLLYIWDLSAFGSWISKWGRYWHFMKNRINVFKSRA